MDNARIADSLSIINYQLPITLRTFRTFRTFPTLLTFFPTLRAIAFAKSSCSDDL
jgi:hypothetical protein